MESLLIVVLGLVLFACVQLVLLARRLDKAQAELARLPRLDALEEQLARLAAQVERREFSVALQSKLTEFTEALARLSASVVGLPR